MLPSSNSSSVKKLCGIQERVPGVVDVYVHLPVNPFVPAFVDAIPAVVVLVHHLSCLGRYAVPVALGGDVIDVYPETNYGISAAAFGPAYLIIPRHFRHGNRIRRLQAGGRDAVRAGGFYPDGVSGMDRSPETVGRALVRRNVVFYIHAAGFRCLGLKLSVHEAPDRQVVGRNHRVVEAVGCMDGMQAVRGQEPRLQHCLAFIPDGLYE